MAQLEALSRESRATFWRSMQTMNVTRVAIAVVLLLYGLFGRTELERGAGTDYHRICITYVLLSVTFAAVTAQWKRRFTVQLMAHVATDVVAISLLYLAAGGMRTGLVILYLFPLAGAAILAPLVLALFWAAVVALFLLGDSTWRIFLEDADLPYLHAALYGAAYFAAVLVISRLAARLINQEELAARRGADLAMQQAINRIVMADMGDGILVAGPDGRIVSANPAARRVLGLSGSAEGLLLSGAVTLAPLSEAFQAWIAEPDGHQMAFVNIKPAGRAGAATHLKVRFARADTPDGSDERCVIFLQDVTAIENRAQELKLASMGRLTASIAHEVRNPLSAIGHATALLEEDLSDKAQVRLLKIVGDNVKRVNRMVEDILQLSRKVQPNGEPLQLQTFLAELKAEFSETHGLAEDLIALPAHTDAAVRFDPLHLREVVVNLLTNAVRYASGTPGCIRLFVVLDAAGRRELHVQDDGPGITPEVRAHLFEPFYTTSSKGTGLGLYLARELCLNNDASLDYEYRTDGQAFGIPHPTGRFVITFGRPMAL
ncbi:PAS domain-containing protein [Massilia arenosa]|uniref:histidine kinase n=1 Tax=Zemynaea arenosa TaxID=2561931 RepID=A0A4Y9RQS7_9BURK|nr:ATP-binding protein [Massilia arenosa]TFW11434.1 PAS domain-containing protein [Massilia arenosa]